MSSAPFTSLAEFQTLMKNVPGPEAAALEGAEARNGTLTKPPGALGRLEDLAIWFAGWQGNPRPTLDHPQAIVFAGNHGVAARGVSAFPPEVTHQMVANFEQGGAAINQLAGAFGANLDVVALDLDVPTADFTEGPAMSEAEVIAALAAGWEAVSSEADLLVTGEMGIGNTTAAAAIIHALFGGAAGDWTGRGTGVEGATLDHKTEVVAAGVARHGSGDPLEMLRCLGGREIAAMAGAMARARMERIPVILDGFICSAAAAVLHRLDAGLLDHAVAGHVSAEGAHAAVLQRLGKEPLLAMNMRLGEGSGAALAIGVLKGAIACHSGMATFAEAGVAGG